MPLKGIHDKINPNEYLKAVVQNPVLTLNSGTFCPF
jgi:hypothetical protein